MARNQTLLASASAAEIPPQNREWLTLEWWSVAEACKYSRFSKGLLYDLINRSLIRSMSLRERGRIKGKRLISSDSLKQFLRSRATGGEALA